MAKIIDLANEAGISMHATFFLDELDGGDQRMCTTHRLHGGDQAPEARCMTNMIMVARHGCRVIGPLDEMKLAAWDRYSESLGADAALAAERRAKTQN